MHVFKMHIKKNHFLTLILQMYVAFIMKVFCIKQTFLLWINLCFSFFYIINTSLNNYSCSSTATALKKNSVDELGATVPPIFKTVVYSAQKLP